LSPLVNDGERGFPEEGGKRFPETKSGKVAAFAGEEEGQSLVCNNR